MTIYEFTRTKITAFLISTKALVRDGTTAFIINGNSINSWADSICLIAAAII